MGFLDKLKKTGSKVGGVLGRVGNWVLNNAQKIGGVVGTIGGLVGNPAVTGLGGVIGAIPSLYNNVKSSVMKYRPTVDNIVNNTSSIVKGIKSDINDNLRNIKDIYHAAKPVNADPKRVPLSD